MKRTKRTQERKEKPKSFAARRLSRQFRLSAGKASYVFPPFLKSDTPSESGPSVTELPSYLMEK